MAADITLQKYSISKGGNTHWTLLLARSSDLATSVEGYQIRFSSP